jgi:ABC-2 type transport system permease protein
MLSRILRHEWRLLTTDGSLWLLIAVFAAAIAYGTFNGVRWVRFQEAAVAEAAREERERYAAQERTIARLDRGELQVSPWADPRNAAGAGGRFGPRYAVMPPAPLAALSVGQSDLLPYYFKVTTEAKEDVTAGTELENPHRLLTGRFDLAFVLISLYPLLVLAFAYNLLSMEKEQGTLALALSQPVSVARLALGKLAVRFAVFLITLAALVLAASLIAGVDVFAQGAGVGAGLWLAVVVAYGLIWFALAIFVASFGRPSATNAMVLAAVWLGFVILVPSLLNLGAATLYPVPSRVEMVQAVREASDEANRQSSVLLARYYEDHPELASGGADQAMNDFYTIRVAVMADVEQRVRPVLDRYERQLAAQRRMVSRLRLFSPAILMQDALNDLSGTGTARHQHFLEQVGRFHESWRAYFVPLIFRKAKVENYGVLPSFVYEEEPERAAISRITGSLGLMLVPALLLGIVGVRRLRRFPVV